MVFIILLTPSSWSVPVRCFNINLIVSKVAEPVLVPHQLCVRPMCVFTLHVYLSVCECVRTVLSAGNAALSKTDEHLFSHEANG